MDETELEHTCLDWFRDTGWDVVHGPDIAPNGPHPARDAYDQVVLRNTLIASVLRINPHLPEDCSEQVLSALLEPQIDLSANNRAFHKMLIDGVPVQYKQDGEINHDHAFLIDFEKTENNRFQAINQFTVQRTKQLRRPDIVCFINGLPIAVLELKSPTDEHADIWDAFNQLQTYKEEISDLFTFNEACIISDGFTARIGALTADKERFMPWRTIKNETDRPPVEWELETMVHGFFNPTLLLEYIRYFVIFENDGGTIIKKIAGSHQFHAVRQAVKATIDAASEKGNKKAGVVWHTQGSGKSLSMCCYAGMLLQQQEMNNPTLIVVTDRNDLDGQLFSIFGHAEALLKQSPVQANGRDELRRLLAEKESGGIIFTTVQKFSPLDDEDEHPVLNERHNIVVISDEAHRSQYGLKATLNKEGAYKYGYAKHMRDAIPNAAFIGFTGTPLSLADKDTRSVFGDYVSVYDIQDAVDDRATVPIYYESRQAKLDINRKEIDALSDQVDEVIEDEEDTRTRERTKGKWSRLEKLIGATPRLKQIAEDIVSHFETRTKTMDGKAMIVGMSREICVRLHDEIISLCPGWHDPDPAKGAIKVIMTGSASDQGLLRPHIYNRQTKKNLEKRFKNINDPLKLVIVRDMWLTGFDAPCCHTMYIDKPMKGHNLMQAIARVNRVFKDKPGGLVVDYIGIANELQRALKIYTDSKGKGTPTLNTEEAYRILTEKLDAARAMFAQPNKSNGFDYTGYEKNARTLLVPAANHILSLNDGKKRFLDIVLAMTKAYSLCSTLDEVKAIKTEIAFFSALKAAITKHTTVDKKLNQEEQNSVLKHILDNAIIAGNVADVFALCGLNKPNIGLLSKEFLEDVRQMPEKHLAIALLEKLLKDDIRARTRNNVVQEKKYSDRLYETLKKYNNRAIETAQVVEELIQMAKEFQDDLQRENKLGLTSDEIAFYDALADNESASRILGDETLKKIAVKVTEKLRQSTIVDWQVRESVRARLRILVRRTLQKYQYPPDQENAAVDLVLKQAEVLANAWTQSE